MTGFLATWRGDLVAANAVHSSPRLTQGDDFDECRRAILQAKQECRSAMRDDGFRPTDEGAREHPTAIADCRVSHCEYAPKDAMEASSSHETANRAVRESKGEHLTARDNAMLSPREFRQSRVPSTVSFARHAGISHIGREFAPREQLALGRWPL